MRKAIVAVVWLCLLPLFLKAQETPKAEWYWGYSLLRIEKTNLHGWNTSIAGILNRNLAIVFDFSGQYGSDEDRFGTTVVSSHFSAHSFLAGPRVSDTVGGRWTPYAHALFGITRLSADIDVSPSGGVPSTVSNSDVGFGMVAGGGLDYQASDFVTFRLIQADYFVARPNGFKDEGARVGAGIVFRLGRKTP